MLWREIQRLGVEEYNRQFVTVFCNTGKEMPQTLDFVHEVETRWNVPIVWLEYRRFPASTIPPEIFPTEKRRKNHLAIGDGLTHWFRVVDYATASRDGKPFDEFLSCTTALPTVVGRSCSAQLKIRTAMRYAFSIGLKEFEAYIGIRNDEAHRAIQIQATCEPFLHPKFPLIESNIIELDVFQFWATNNFDLTIPSLYGNCDLCFLKSKWKRVAIMRENPKLADWWISKENHFTTAARKGTKITFREGETYEGVLSQALHPEFDFNSADKNDIACSCAERGFEAELE